MPHVERADTTEPRHVGEIFDDPRPGYMFRKAIEAVKDAVPIEQVAAEYGEFKLQGAGRLLGHCVAPDHTDRTPSMNVYTETGRWKCYGCGIYGDVVDLERVAGRHLEAWTAVVALAERYGVELPRRSKRWHEWQTEKGRRHDELRRWRERRYQRRLYRLFAAESIAAIEDDAERTEEARKTWEELGTLARLWAA
ncbi:MAG: CHC2 zinc finger domain-containing protein, partial [Actinomycetota bacterium]|nr:CHC2 zinc finger domain-containing protein [Actinomycetota bacterium]